jgi:hypothetical protein
MEKPERDEVQTALAIVKLHPGITRESLAVQLGYTPTIERAGRDGRIPRAKITRIVEILKQKHKVQIVEPKFKDSHAQLRLYAHGAKIPQPKPIFQSRVEPACNVYVDPAIKGSWKPPNSSRQRQQINHRRQA